MCNVFRAGHGLRYAKPTRRPPAVDLFPNYIQNNQGLWLRFAEWWPRTGAIERPRGVVFIVSGLGEHSGRYDAIARRLNTENYVVFSVDNQGAGGSEGVRLYVERFVHFVEDVEMFVRAMYARYPALHARPVFLLGHSMGGLIATHVALRDPSFFRGVVLSGPAYAIHGSSNPNRVLRWVLRRLSSILPKLPLASLNAAEVSRNAPVVELVQQDPFYCNARLRARFMEEFLIAQEGVFAAIQKASFPFLVVHGEEDTICSVEGARRFFREAPSTDKTMMTYPDACHEVLTEVCGDQVMQDVLSIMKRWRGEESDDSA